MNIRFLLKVYLNLGLILYISKIYALTGYKCRPIFKSKSMIQRSGFNLIGIVHDKVVNKDKGHKNAQIFTALCKG